MIEVTLSSNHPPLPPTTEENRLSSLRLLRSRRVGISTFHRLLAEHGSASNALKALPEIAKSNGVGNYTPCPEAVARAELKAGKSAGAQLIMLGEPDYPKDLAQIVDAPPLLWCMGQIDILQKPMIALVGARNASSLGTRMARTLAIELSKVGWLVVSGLARGVDTAAHLATVKQGTVAVMAGGVDVIYPTENTRLAKDILNQGVLVSEQPMGQHPQARHFPKRNRIISGLAKAVVVVEAAAKSGSLITAKNALDQGRDVAAVPGHPLDARASGCNMLIRDGACLVRTAEDVIALVEEAQKPLIDQIGQPTLFPSDLASPPRPAKDMARLHQDILSRLGPSPVGEDQLIRDLGQSAQTVAPALVELELDGKITRQSGGLLSLKT